MSEKVIEEEIKIDAEALKGISDEVAKELAPKIEEAVKAAGSDKADVEAIAQKAIDDYVAKTEEVEKKVSAEKAEKALAADPVAKAVKEFGLEDIADESKEMRLFKAARALASGDSAEVKRYNQYSIAARQKAGYANEGTTADGGALVPDPEFDTNVYENLPNYGVAFADADVRQTTHTSVRFLSLDSGLAFYATAEAGVKTGAKLSFTKQLVDLQKYAVIVPSTDELTDDAAIDYWNLVTKELTRAYAKKADEVVFTDSTSGIIHTTGVITEPTSGGGTTIAWDDLLSAEGNTEDDQDNSGAKWYMRKETYFRLVATKASGSGEYLWEGFLPNPNSPTTPWGTPIVFTRVLPKSVEVGNNAAFAVYGDLSNYVLYNKKGMDLTVLKEATVVDASGSDFNLATQDGTAMRAVIRMLGKLPKGNASKFVILGTGTVS